MHTAIIVKDLDKSRIWYSDLGFALTEVQHLDSIGVRLCYATINGMGEVELIEGASEQHIAFEVEDLETWLGIHKVDIEKDIFIEEWGKRAVFFRGLDGEFIEVLER